jgi:ABC-type Fe3+-hydroxamate transport system substrate-binding protein
MNNCDDEIHKLCILINDINNNGEKIWIYGASTKGNCLLQYAKINNDQIQYAVERNPTKIGKMTATGIEIISEETMRENRPDYLLVLPWHFRDEIIERENEFLNNGGKIVFPLPILEIYGRTK